jgi:hypothetical protein
MSQARQLHGAFYEVVDDGDGIGNIYLAVEIGIGTVHVKRQDFLSYRQACYDGDVVACDVTVAIGVAYNKRHG